MIRPAILLLALLTALPAAAEIYSWKDKDGRTHYSDIPPPSGPVKTLRGTPPPASAPQIEGEATDDAANEEAAQPEAEQPVDPDTAFRQRRAEQAEAEATAAQNAADEAERQRFCTDARNQLTALDSGQRIARMNSAGEREFVDDAARAAESERLRQQIEQHCN
ncbi:DUF4124 domain-containing protein [Thauera sp. Sel9]|uniref:DUF4124 domain-containing protein n=1 Tax=Thauera sp. Sel9 TaxID=2974299 RepID=UPI0021E1282B|nr:DUF4124 domain-containing protein [Thauera sp. Sel9]MCV2219874.1 DUF4124 domain-containing protein [Thauera sp. Sel9]